MQQNNPWADTAQQAISALFGHYMTQRKQAAPLVQQPQTTTEMYGGAPVMDIPEFQSFKGAPQGHDPKIKHIQLLANQYGVDPRIATGVFGAESSFGRNTGPSSAGAIGPMQVMPGTMADPGFGVKPAQDQSYEELARVGMEYLAAMKNKYGNYNDALVAYNWGPGNADKWKQRGAQENQLPAETSNYLRKVMGYANNG